MILLLLLLNISINKFLHFDKLGNLVTISTGCGLGWLSPALLTLKSYDTPLSTGPLTVDEISWIGSIPQLSGLISFPIAIYLANYFGRKTVLSSLTIPLIVSCIIIV